MMEKNFKKFLGAVNFQKFPYSGEKFEKFLVNKLENFAILELKN